MADYVAVPSKTRVAFQGELGAYSDEAIKSRWSDTGESIPVASFSDVVALVKSDRVEYGVIPIWNTILGMIAPGHSVVRSAVTRSDRLVVGLAVVGDVHVVVRHHLLALPGTALDELDSVASHPVALAQCQRFLERHPRLIPQSAYDTAGAARDIAVRRTRGAAAIAGLAASKRYGLTSIASDIQDVPDNITHFVVLARLDVADRMGARLW